MPRTPIMGAGGIVVRGGPRPLIALVQRSKDDAWVLPKGKLKRKEAPIAAAEREVVEETGYRVEIHDYLGAISYKVGRKLKLVEFWRMQALGKTGRRPTDDIKAALASVGGSFEHVVKLNSYLTNIEANAAEFREVRASYFPNRSALPASTLLQVPRLANPAYLLEVEVIAVLPPRA